MFNYTYYDILRLENSAAAAKIASPNEQCYSGCISGPLRGDEGTGSAIPGLNFRPRCSRAAASWFHLARRPAAEDEDA